LDSILAESRRLAAQGVAPAVIMDLDETVVDSVPRRWAAYQAETQKACAKDGPAFCEAVRSLNVSEIYGLPNRYDASALALRLGVDPSAPAWRSFASAMFDEYLSGRHERLDQSIAGASAYVRELRKAGVAVWFVSSRWKDSQGASTLASLRELGMIEEGCDAGAQVILRPRHMASLEFKRDAFARIREAVRVAGGRVVGLFENEPENASAMEREFPATPLVFVTGAALEGGEAPARAIRIADYR
jgi:predicted secreted acid phosphatase